MAESDAKKIIIVAGVEYPRYDYPAKKIQGRRGLWYVLRGGRKIPARGKSGSHWREKGVALAKQRLRADPTIEVYLYDFDRSTRERVRLIKGVAKFEKVDSNFPPFVDSDYRWVDDDRLLQPVTAKLISASTLKGYPHIRYFPQVSSKVSTGPAKEQDWIKEVGGLKWEEVGMSIRHVYKFVEDIGKTSPGTLHEVHLLGHASSSHGAESGTVFVNTDNIIRGARHPLDLDARADIDFTSATIDRAAFRKAFATSAMSQIWGCNWHRPLFDMARQASKQVGAKKMRDDATLTFRWRDPGVSGPLAQFKQILKAESDWDGKTNSVKRPGKFVREELTRLMLKTYMQQLADVSKSCVAGGLPGTYSDYDEAGSPRLSHIPMGHYGTGDTFSSVLRLYLLSLGVKFTKGTHPKYGRGFGIYCAAP